MSARPGDLQCQKCPDTYPWRGSRSRTEAAARFRDWRVFEGVTGGGAEIKVVLCPVHSGVEKKKRIPPHEPLDGQLVFDLEELPEVDAPRRG